MDNNQNENQGFQNGNAGNDSQGWTNTNNGSYQNGDYQNGGYQNGSYQNGGYQKTATRTMDIMASHSIIIREIIRREEDIPLRV